jgi:large subunit ribosomal protein L18
MIQKESVIAFASVVTPGFVKESLALPACPRLVVFRSNKNIEAQIIDDVKGVTLVASGSVQLKLQNGGNCVGAAEVGKDLAAKAKKAGISHVVFDRGGYQYHGRVAALADAAREGGLLF